MPNAARKKVAMAADQAAGLRRRRRSTAPRLVHSCVDSPEFTRRLVQALHGLGGSVLLIDTGGRLFADVPTRSLFDWRQQLARKQPHLVPLADADGWFAPGLRADAPGLCDLARDYEYVVLDAPPKVSGWALVADAVNAFVVDCGTSIDGLAERYALLKTLATKTGGARVHIGLIGDTAAGDRLLAACRHFLAQSFSQRVYNLGDADDAFAALAARMAVEETSLTARNNTGNP